MERRSPDRVFVRKDDIEDFKLLLQEKDSPFFKRDNKAVFLMAMIWGFHSSHKMELDKKEGYVRTEYFSPDEQSLIKAIAISAEGDLKVLLDKQKVYSIAEQYAAGGIKYLKEEAFESRHGTFAKRLEALLLETYEKLCSPEASRAHAGVTSSA